MIPALTPAALLPAALTAAVPQAPGDRVVDYPAHVIEPPADVREIGAAADAVVIARFAGDDTQVVTKKNELGAPATAEVGSSGPQVRTC